MSDHGLFDKYSQYNKKTGYFLEASKLLGFINRVYKSVVPSAALMVWAETDAAKADIFVDGIKVKTVDPKVNGWVHCNPVIIIKEQKEKEHLVRIQIVKGEEEKKFTILGFGYVEA